jgi:hypothetical protein
VVCALGSGDEKPSSPRSPFSGTLLVISASALQRVSMDNLIKTRQSLASDIGRM